MMGTMSAGSRVDTRTCELSQLRTSLNDSQIADLEDLLESARRMLSWESLPGFDDVHDFTAATEVLARSWAAIVEAIRGDGAAAEHVTSATDLTDLLIRVDQAGTVIRDAETRHRDNALRAARTALSRFEDITAVGRVIEEGAAAVCSLGFDRAIVSRIDESVWMTEKIVVERDAEWADAILTAGRANPQVIGPGLPEQELVRRRQPILVTGVQRKTRVHQAVAQESLSRSYVAAPIAPRSKVLGFLHGDRYFHRGDVTAFDRDLLGFFAEGFGFALERAMLFEQIEQIRSDVRSFSAGIDRALDRSIAGFDLSSRPTAAMAMPPAGALAGISMAPEIDEDSRLTRREMEVLRHMASGDTNLRIAHRLVISEGTVKSHVKHILRKLGAANRAEAVAKWHQSAAR